MQIVIDIPKKSYEDIRQADVAHPIFKAIKNGTPLPKGHGNLFDEKVLKEEYILALPSVNPTTNRAKWIKVGEHLYECSCCGYNYRNYDGQVMKFCMNCGSVMEGGE